eukprot:5610166-Amphidinium_carterae.1
MSLTRLPHLRVPIPETAKMTHPRRRGDCGELSWWSGVGFGFGVVEFEKRSMVKSPLTVQCV